MHAHMHFFHTYTLIRTHTCTHIDIYTLVLGIKLKWHCAGSVRGGGSAPLFVK